MNIEDMDIKEIAYIKKTTMQESFAGQILHPVYAYNEKGLETIDIYKNIDRKLMDKCCDDDIYCKIKMVRVKLIPISANKYSLGDMKIWQESTCSQEDGIDIDTEPIPSVTLTEDERKYIYDFIRNIKNDEVKFSIE